MAIHKFRDAGLSSYFYDTQADQVFSTRSGQAKPMKWTHPSFYKPKRVSMTTNQGLKVSYTRDQILKILAPAVVVAPVAVTNDLTLIKPNFEYVMFSVGNKCSQYFFAGTSVKDALDRFAKRGEVIKPADVRILDPLTGKINKLGVKTVETYTLV
jgi:hypothetical protein